MGFPRIAPAGGLAIGDRTLPEGTTVSVNPWVMHHSTELWGDDAHAFNPDRWLGKDAALREKYWVSVSNLHPPFKSCICAPKTCFANEEVAQFGAGYGACPGQNVAKIELAKITATLVRDYDIKLVDEQKDWKWKAYFTVVPHSWPVFVEKVA
jgi:cytochrome P450